MSQQNLQFPLTVVRGSEALGRDLLLTRNGLVERIVNTNGGFFFAAHGWMGLEHPVEETDIPRILDTYHLDAGELTILRRLINAK